MQVTTSCVMLKGEKGIFGIISPGNAYLDHRLRGFFKLLHVVFEAEKEEQSCGCNWNCQSPGTFGF